MIEKRKKRLILIDGINFFYRGVWSKANAVTNHGEDMSCCLTFFRNLTGMMRKFGMYDENRYVICWDAGYNERMRISSAAVVAGIIPKTYKQERRDARETEDPVDKAEAISFMRQMAEARRMTGYTIVGQCSIPGEEADDVIGSFAKKYYDEFDKIVLVTTDRDYYQLLNDKVMMYNSGKAEFTTIDNLKTEYNLSSGEQWIDIGALAGESGKSSDTIYGVPGIGYKTAAKLITQYETLDNLMKTASVELAGDIIANDNDIKKLYENVSEKKYKLKHHQKEMKVLAFSEVVEIAKKLKAMRTFLPVEMPHPEPSWTEFEKELSSGGIHLGKSMTEDLTEPGKYGFI